jgi:hypothetical protein
MLFCQKDTRQSHSDGADSNVPWLILKNQKENTERYAFLFLKENELFLKVSQSLRVTVWKIRF